MVTFEPARGRQADALALELVGGLVAHQLEGVAAFDQGLALGEQSLQFDGFDLAAILLALACALRLLVVVEFALDPVDGAVEEIRRSTQRRLSRSGSRRVSDNVDQRASKMSAMVPASTLLRGEAGDRVRRRRDGSHRVEVRAGRGRSGMSRSEARNRRDGQWSCRFPSSARAHRGLLATKAEGGADLHPK